jgi:lipopolysaccharide/colanic/teichoic acid biosynthesis glycosyltransferase
MIPAEQIQIDQEFLEETQKNMRLKKVNIDNRHLHILYVDHNENARNHLKSMFEYAYENKFTVTTLDSGYQAFKWLQEGHTPDVIISEHSLTGMSGLQFLRLIRISDTLEKTPFVFVSHNDLTKNERMSLLKTGADDLFYKPLEVDKLAFRIKYLFEIKHFNRETNSDFESYKMPLGKRIFDIAASGLALLFLLPVFAIVGLIIKLESRGPVFYRSKRVGMGYQIFDLIKFRSMDSNADKNIHKLKHLNLYQNKDSEQKAEDTPPEPRTIKEEDLVKASGSKKVLVSDEGVVAESKTEAKKANAPIFMKFKDDPRVTRFGRFIRKTSIDELPQLINVLIGDISVVGNRPLPLYEAEKLTTDAFSERFIAPAGITGLWQVTKRGKSDMSEEERIALDNQYARNCSLGFDVKIILKTFPALLQTENV